MKRSTVEARARDHAGEAHLDGSSARERDGEAEQRDPQLRKPDGRGRDGVSWPRGRHEVTHCRHCEGTKSPSRAHERDRAARHGAS